MAAGLRDFKRVLKGAMGGQVLIPPLRAILSNPNFAGFDVHLPDWRPRKPDGYFHPSTHPLWPERLLYLYLTQPDRMLDSDLDNEGTLATTQGTFWHSFLQHVMLLHNLVLEMNPKGKYVPDRVEYFVADEVLGSRGAMDGVLNPEALKIEMPEGLEIKTMNSMKLSKCPKGAPSSPERIQWLIEKSPVYYAQAQEYLRMSGYSVQRFLFIGLEYPFPMEEIAMPFSYADSAMVADKYKRVRQAVADREMPDPCCAIGSAQAKQCPARGICPVGKASV